MSRKRPSWSWLLLALLVLPAVWAFGIEPRWVAQREIEHAVPQWRGPAGLKVAVAADWHFSRKPFWRVMTPDRARAIVDEINAARPDVVLLPGYDAVRDEAARVTLQECFPTRRVVVIDCRELIWGLGAIHCLTQQMPKIG